MKTNIIRLGVMPHGIIVSLSLCAAALHGADVEYAYTSGATTLGDGAVSILYNDNAQITNLVATPVGSGKVTIKGDEMTFGGGANVSLAQSGTLSFANKVTAAGALSLERGDGMYLSWTGSEVVANYIAAFPKDLIKGQRIEKWVVVSSHIRNKQYSSDKNNILGMAYPHVVNNGGGTPKPNGDYYMRFLSLNHWNGRRTYGIRLQMLQSAKPDANGLYGDISIRCIRWSQSHYGLNITDKDVYSCTPEGRGNWQDPVGATAEPCKVNSAGKPTDEKGNAYPPTFLKMDQLTIRHIDAGESTVRFDGETSFGGQLDVGVGLNAVLAVSDASGTATLSNKIGGEGTFRIESKVAGDKRWHGAGIVAYDGYLPPNKWEVVAENRSLSTLTNIVGYMHGSAHYSGKEYNYEANPPITAVRLKNRGGEADCQFQFLMKGEDVIKTVKARFRQNGANIEGQAVGAGYKKVEDGYSLGDDMDILKDWEIKSVASSATTGAYGIEHLTFFFNDENAVHVSLNSVNTMTGAGQIEFAGTEGCPLIVTLDNKDCLPTGGIVRVKSDAKVLQTKGGNIWAVYSGGRWSLQVEPGGAFHKTPLAGGGGIWSEALLSANGGTIDLSAHSSSAVMTYTQAGTYANLIELSGGARAIGDSPAAMAATGMTGLWRVVGDTPCHFDCGVAPGFYVNGKTNPDTFYMEFYVENVTKDAAVDATLAAVYPNGEMNPTVSAEGYFYQCTPIHKTGAGTLRIDGTYKAAVMSTLVKDGTFMLGKSGITASENDFNLVGGSLAADAGTVNELGKLAVNSDNAKLELTDGSSLSFADSSSVAWSGRLAITVPEDAVARVRFGTSSSALTAAQLSSVRMNGRYVKLDNNGYLTYCGFVMIVR